MADSLNDPLLKSAPAAPAADASAAPSGGASSSTSTGGTSTAGSSVGAASRRKQSTQDQVNETLEMVKAYALQETVNPLKTAGRWIALGLVGAVLIGMATFFLSLGLLRLVQTEFPDAFDGRWTKLLPYLFALVLCTIVIVAALSRINKQPLTKEKR
ncbi:MAG: hypothetical protein ACOYMR_15375 [Ilumatobacteraceae bacterium]